MIICDIKKDKHGAMLVGKLHSTLFGRDMDVIIHGEDEAMREYAEKCAEYFNHMPPELMGALKKYSLRYCEDMRKYFDPECPDVPESVTEDDILDYVRPNCLIVEKPKDESRIAFGVEMNCDWEPEHGMEWTINNGRALYVGDFISVSPWYDEAVYQRQCRSYVCEDFSL